MSAGWTFLKFLLAAATDAMSITTYRDGWQHVLHADWTLQFIQDILRQILNAHDFSNGSCLKHKAIKNKKILD
jgi:hypothetical protein